MPEAVKAVILQPQFVTHQIIIAFDRIVVELIALLGSDDEPTGMFGNVAEENFPHLIRKGNDSLFVALPFTVKSRLWKSTRSCSKVSASLIRTPVSIKSCSNTHKRSSLNVRGLNLTTARK